MNLSTVPEWYNCMLNAIFLKFVKYTLNKIDSWTIKKECECIAISYVFPSSKKDWFDIHHPKMVDRWEDIKQNLMYS